MNDVHPELDDLDLIKRYLEADDRTALGILFERHSDLAYRMACRVMRNPEEAEDAVQTAFMNAIRFLPRYRGGAGFRVWLTKVVIGTCKTKIRDSVRRRNREEHASEDQEPSAMNEEENKNRLAELTDAILAELDKLPELYRLPIWLHYYEDLTFQDVAAALASSENTVKSQARRGMAMLKDNLGNLGYAVPSLSLVSAFPGIPSESAPPSLAKWIQTSVHGTLPPGVGSSFPVVAVASIALVASALALGAALLSAGPGSIPTAVTPPISAPSTADPGFFWSTDFNTPDSTNTFSLALGAIRHLPSGGPDGSGCIESTEPETMININIPVERLPVLITYRQAGVIPTPIPADVSFTSLIVWDRVEAFARFHGIGTRRRFKPSSGNLLPWQTSREFVTDTFIDRWTDNDHIDFIAFQRAPDSKLQLGLRGKQRVDDLTIRSIQSNEIPNVEIYLRAIARIPMAQRKGHVPVPELKPATPNGTTPTIFFYSASD